MKRSTSAIGLYILLSSPVWPSLNEVSLFTMKKSHHPENIMVITAKVDENCAFVPYKDGSYMGYHWLMDRKKRKEVHPLIKKGIAKRVKFEGAGSGKRNEFKVTLNDLDEVEHDLPTTTINVASRPAAGGCAPKAKIKLGPKGDNKTIDLANTYCEVDKNVFGVPTGCERLQLQGFTEEKGKPVSVSFKQK